MEGWAMGRSWEAEDETNPLWDLTHHPLMSVPVMDHTVGYLVYHAILTETGSSRATCLVPPSLFGAMKQIEGMAKTSGSVGLLSRTPEDLMRLRLQRDMVWVRQDPPTRVIIPVIDHQQMHCYLWYGDIKPRQGRSAYHCELKYLDSLIRPSERALAERFVLAKAIVRALLPQINGEISSGGFQFIEGFRQAPGSTDCGYYVCQAVSALAFHCDEALKRLQPVPQVKTNIRNILESCHDNALQRLSKGMIAKNLILLHRPLGITPPPWQSDRAVPPATLPIGKEIPRWSTPEYIRSLSEPQESYRTLRHGVSNPLSWAEVFGPMPSPNFDLVDPNSAGRYLNRLRDSTFRMPPGLLHGVSSAAPDHFLESLLLRTGDVSNVRWLPGVTVVGGEDEEELERPQDCLGVRIMCEALRHLKEGQERSLAVLTGTNAGQPLRLNWAKDSLDLDEEWLSASLDVDSLSLTVADPDFTSPAVVHPYPPRAGTLTNDNGLSVSVDGVKTPLSHSKWTHCSESSELLT